MAALSLGEAVLQLSKTSAPQRLVIPALLRLRPLDASPGDTRSDANDPAQQHDPGWGVGRCAPLWIAARRGATEFVAALLEAGANTEWTSDCVRGDGCTALHIAARYGHVAIAELLIEAAADLDAVTKTGETPLMTAARHDKPAIAALLLRADADTALENDDCKTALALAVEEGHTSVATLLAPAAAPKLDPRCAEWAAARAASPWAEAKATAKMEGPKIERAVLIAELGGQSMSAIRKRCEELGVPETEWKGAKFFAHPTTERAKRALILAIVARQRHWWELTLRSMFGEQLHLKVNQLMSVRELKEMLCRRKGEADVDALRLLHDGEALEDEHATLRELGFTEETVVFFASQQPELARARRQQREATVLCENPLAEESGLFRVKVKTACREDKELGSRLTAGSFSPGEVVEALEEALNSNGERQIRTAQGWISAQPNVLEPAEGGEARAKAFEGWVCTPRGWVPDPYMSDWSADESQGCGWLCWKRR